jgi:DNA-directed RNA polymerase subunit alpha
MISNYQINFPVIKTRFEETKDENTYKLVIEPLLPGFGYTLGNSLRRILLSSIPGYAVTKIKINNTTHEYQGIEGVVEDVMDIILNLKRLRCKIITDDEKILLRLNKKGSGEVKAKDFEKNSQAEVINPDLYICSLDKNGEVDIEVEVSKGIGYLPVEQIQDKEIGTLSNFINVDALFSPVENVSFEVEKVRVGEKTNFDKIELLYTSDGTVDPKEIANFTFNLAVDLFQKIHSSFNAEKDSAEVVAKQQNTPLKSKPEENNSEDEIDLPKRIKNNLEKNGITTNQQLLEKKEEVKDYSGITEKALVTITEYIEKISK